MASEVGEELVGLGRVIGDSSRTASQFADTLVASNAESTRNRFVAPPTPPGGVVANVAAVTPTARAPALQASQYSARQTKWMEIMGSQYIHSGFDTVSDTNVQYNAAKLSPHFPMRILTDSVSVTDFDFV
jgi:hypothetical protein